MRTERLIEELKGSLDAIEHLKTLKEGIKHPKVKAWRARTLELLNLGGKACKKAHATLHAMQFNSKSFEDTFVGQQGYINQHEAMKKILEQTIMTLDLFGRPEDQGELPQWRPPAKNRIVKGHLIIDGMEVAPDSVSLEEMFRCFEHFVRESPALTEEMQATLLSNLEKFMENDLYKPFLSQRLDQMFAHWPDTT